MKDNKLNVKESVDLENLLSNNNDIEIQKRNNLYIINARTDKYKNNFFYKGHNLYDDFYIIAEADNKGKKDTVNLAIRHHLFSLSGFLLLILGILNMIILSTIVYYNLYMKMLNFGDRLNYNFYFLVAVVSFMMLNIYIKINRFKKEYLFEVSQIIKIRLDNY